MFDTILINLDNQPVAQPDSEPGGGLNPTTHRPPGEIILDNHGVLIPADLVDGNYKLRIGLTDPNVYLPIQIKEGFVDAYSIATISVK